VVREEIQRLAFFLDKQGRHTAPISITPAQARCLPPQQALALKWFSHPLIVREER
jgi:hypothetical protein